MNAYTLKIAGFEFLYNLYPNFHKPKLTDNNILISGTTRGGTTWLMEMLYTKNMQVVWEPTKYETLVKFHGNSFAKALGIMPYIPEDAVWDEAYEYFQNLLHGDERVTIDINSHPLLLTNPFSKNRLLIKCCNTNLLLPWLCKNFNIRPIVLVRNPMAVIASQLQHPGFKKIGTQYNLFLLNDSKYKDIFQKYEQQISAINSQVSMLANWWAIQHVELMKKAEKYTIVNYENLVKEAKIQLNELFNKYRISKSIDSITINKPSSTSNQFNGDAVSYLDEWKKHLSQEQIEDISEIIRSYGITNYV